MAEFADAYELNNPPVIAELLEGEIVAIDLDAGNYFSIRGKAAEVFGLLAGGSPLAAIVRAAPGRDAAALGHDLLRFAERCLADNLLRPRKDACVTPVAAVLAPWTGDDLRYETFTDMQNLLGLDPVHEADDKLGWPVVAGKPAT